MCRKQIGSRYGYKSETDNLASAEALSATDSDDKVAGAPHCAA